MADQEKHSFFGENRSLFSDYYLKERLRNTPEWEQDLAEPFEQALQIYRKNKAALPGMNEAQTENEFIQPVLEQVLGFHYDVQKAEKSRGRTNIPDYIFFPDEESLKGAQQNRDSNKYYNDALALGDAKYWDRPLDSKGVAEKDLYTNSNPSFQIVNYLTVTGLEWGILTNGSRWRLYSTKARSRIDSYFEIDLKRILEEEDQEQFKYFYHFFRRQAYQKDPETGQSFVERVFEGSIDYGSRLEKQLKDLIFEDVFLLLSRGFVQYRDEEIGIDEETQESLDEIYQGTLRLLYRLLFLLHAESRQLLPLDNRDYLLQYSLMELKKQIAERQDKNLTPSSRSFDVWNDLDSLFHIIDKGAPDLNVPRYNGGLFRQDHPNNRFLTEYKIADKYLVPALELLTRETKPDESGRKPFIDYKSLNVEQLGSIYEGLLEFHLRQADQPLAVVKENGKEVYKPKSEADNPSMILEKGELYLENDKGERKATGSYYTPHYIVEYIVEHTLGPVFEERAATFEELMEKLEPKYEKFKELDEKITEGDRSERTHNRRKELNLVISTLENRAAETILSLKICDPAMGSGHFLKEATDKLAEKIITLLAEYPTNPVTNLLEDIRSQILESLEDQHITIDAEEHLKDTNLIKRMVMKRSIYGVDLNPMAVELAKLSLWLDSFTVGAPLSFLDHHLKVGNSLIGTTVGEIREQLETGQSHMFGGPFSGLLNATELMREVSVKTDATYSEVEQSIARYHDFEEAVSPYKKVLDIWLSRHFDNERAGDFLMTFSDQITNLLKGEDVELGDKQQAIIDKAEALEDEKHFFHWELEFPEVFVDLKQSKWLDNPGFDAVVGNPPWGGELTEKEKEFFRTFDTDTKIPNNYIYFQKKAEDITKKEHFLTFVLPDSLLIKEYPETRERLVKDRAIKEIIFVKNTGVNSLFRSFKGVNHDVIILRIKKTRENNPMTDIRFCMEPQNIEEISSRSVEQKIYDDPELEYRLNLIIDQDLIDQKERMDKKSWKLKEKFESHEGIHSGNVREKLFFPPDSNPDLELDPLIMGTSHGDRIKRYQLNWGGWQVNYDESVIDTDNNEYASLREERIFTSTKLFVVRTGDFFAAAFDDQQFYASNNLFSLLKRPEVTEEYSLRYIQVILNSKLGKWYLRTYIAPRFGDLFTETKIKHLDLLPIRQINFQSDRNRENFNDEIRKQILNNEFKNAYKELAKVIDEDDRLDLVHDSLVLFAKHMRALNEERENLWDALNPFDFLNKGVKFGLFKDIFRDAIKYGHQLTGEVDIGTVHHDIEELHLRPDGDGWLLSAQLKHRDPETDWDDWVKEDGNIVRTIHDIYRFDLSDEEARYWQQSFEVLDEFANSGNFPGGKTRSTFEKLMKSEVPVFDESANIEPLIELQEELAEVNDKIEKTDWLIDQVVYRLYGLSEEEIEVVENT